MKKNKIMKTTSLPRKQKYSYIFNYTTDIFLSSVINTPHPCNMQHAFCIYICKYIQEANVWRFYCMLVSVLPLEI